MGQVADNIGAFLEEIPANVKLIPVSKTKPNEMILDAWEAGHKVFGENKVQDMARKYEELPKDISWHMIGHLQSNKVKYMAPFVSLVHAVDSLKLLKVINKEGVRNSRIIDVLLQFHIASEETKFGLLEDELPAIFDSAEFASMDNVRIRGVMGMASNISDERQVGAEFAGLYKIYSRLRAGYFVDKDYFSELSMGMSQDYRIAIGEGSTMIRIGSSIFGSRVY